MYVEIGENSYFQYLLPQVAKMAKIDAGEYFFLPGESVKNYYIFISLHQESFLGMINAITNLL